METHASRQAGVYSMQIDFGQFDRYHRQTLLPGVGRAGQKKLADARILLVGCGALGCTVADLLARAGVGLLRIVDRDLVDFTNLQRQTLFSESHAQQQSPKALAAAERLAAINSAIIIEPVVKDVSPRNVAELTDSIHLIIDGTDNVSTRYLLNDVAVERGLPWIYGACVGTTGRVMAIRPGQSACLRCLYPDPPQGSNLPTCDTAGVLGPAAAVVGALQASAVIRLLIDGSTDAMLSINLWPTEFRQIESTRQPQPDCPCCGQRQFDFLHGVIRDQTVSLCGRNAMQVWPEQSGRIDLQEISQRWEKLGQVESSRFYVRCHLTSGDGLVLTLFPDGRMIVQGTSDANRASSIYSRYLGS